MRHRTTISQWTLVATAAIFAQSSAATPPGGGHGFHAPMPNQELFVACQIGAGAEAPVVEAVLKMPSTMVPAELGQPLALPKPHQPVTIGRYLPQAVHRQSAVTDEQNGRPLIQLAIAGRKQSFERWLVAGDYERGRLISMVGTWRYQAVSSKSDRDELYRQFEQERTRPARIVITRAGAGEERTGDNVDMAADKGAKMSSEQLGCTVTVLEFFPHFGMDKTTEKPVNQSDKRINPAALVKIEQAGSTQEQWIFAKFPQFQAHGSADAALQLTLDCPIETKNPVPDFLIVKVAGADHERWTRHEGQVAAAPLPAKQEVAIPGSNYVFSIIDHVASGRLAEAYEITDSRSGATTAIRLDVATTPKTTEQIWIELGKARAVQTDQGVLTFSFLSRPAQPAGAKP